MSGRVAVAGLLLVLLSCAGAARAEVELGGLDRDMVGPRTQVLTLGSVHLSQLPTGVTLQPDTLQPVLQRLLAYRPDVITVEALSGETCDLMARHPTVYLPDDVSTYCPDTQAAKAATGLDVPAAIAEMRQTLKAWPQVPSAAQRRRLAAVFLAAGEPASALVQWLQLADAQRRAGDGLDAALVKRLRALQDKPDESLQIAATIAAHLGLQRVFPVDDHTGDNVDLGGPPEVYGKAIQALWDRAAPQAKPMRDHEDALARQGNMLALYRAVNDPANQQRAIESDFAAALRDDSPQRYGQRYVAGWEARNLRMVANIRVAFADQSRRPRAGRGRRGPQAVVRQPARTDAGSGDRRCGANPEVMASPVASTGRARWGRVRSRARRRP